MSVIHAAIAASGARRDGATSAFHATTTAECLRILGCEGDRKASRFAEICAAVALAGELSIAGAMCSGDFASAHEKLGRRGPP